MIINCCDNPNVKFNNGDPYCLNCGERYGTILIRVPARMLPTKEPIRFSTNSKDSDA